MRAPAHPLLVAATVLLVGRGVPLPADGQNTRHGFWTVLGLGTGSANISCDGCSSGWNYGGPTLIAQLGGTMNPHLRVGFGLDEWWHFPSDTADKLLKTATGLLHYYPFVRSGLYVEGGAGWSRAEARVGRAFAKGDGLGLVSGLGYDIPVLRGLMLTPRVTYAYALIGGLKYRAGGSTFTRGWKHEVLSVGLGLTIHEL